MDTLRLSIRRRGTAPASSGQGSRTWASGNSFNALLRGYDRCHAKDLLGMDGIFNYRAPTRPATLFLDALETARHACANVYQTNPREGGRERERENRERGFASI